MYNSHKELFDKTFLATFPDKKACEIIGKERMQELTMDELDLKLLYELWTAHENLFMVMAYHAYEGKGKELDKLFKPGGKEARAEWDFYLDDDQLLSIDSGRKRAMCVKFWRKIDFESLAEWVSKNYKFIDAQKCL